MILQEVVEQIISPLNSGEITNDMRWVPEQVAAMVPSLRQQAIIDKYNGSRYIAASPRIEGSWVQKFSVTVDESIQDNDLEYLVVNIGAPIAINQNNDGFIYVGVKDKTISFKKAQSRDEIATLRQRNFINNGKYIVYMYSNGQLEIYGDKMLKSFYVEMILQDPLQATGFNPQTSFYPISDSILGLMQDGFKAKMGIAVQQTPDPVADQADTPSTPRVKAGIV